MAPKILLDVNICLDVLLDRLPFIEEAGKIFNSIELNKVDPYLSAISFDRRLCKTGLLSNICIFVNLKSSLIGNKLRF